MSDLKLPKSMGLIVRTAGLSRTKTEIKRDFDYLARLWDEIRERTLGSTAPALIYRDSDLIKRAIRDIYNRDIDEVIVEGEEGYKAARGFMKLLMPSHVRRVSAAQRDRRRCSSAHGVEDQLSAMYQPIVQLKSGGYLVINPTEALVSIDINSGRSTREHNIEQTAFATNIEAAHEIARQLRLRDMAGLVVIDFIDMEQNSHVRKVEKAMKDALKNDRARIQVGRISSFGLMEMSRQRLRTGVLEASTKPCPHCEGTGLMRTAASAGLSALRMIEDEAARGRGERISLRAGREAAVYVLNKKRTELAEIEQRYGVFDRGRHRREPRRRAHEGRKLRAASGRRRPRSGTVADRRGARVDEFEAEIDEDEEDEEDAEDEEVREARAAAAQPRGRGSRARATGKGRKRRRRRRGGRGRRRDGEGEGERRWRRASRARPKTHAAEPSSVEAGQLADGRDGRSSRGAGRSPRRSRRTAAAQAPPSTQAAGADAEAVAEPQAEIAVPEPRPGRGAARRNGRPGRVLPKTRRAGQACAQAAHQGRGLRREAPRRRPPVRNRQRRRPAADNDAAETEDDGEPRRGGWWQRTFG